MTVLLHASKAECQFQHLGQTGLRISAGSLCILVDPYLSDSVQLLDSSDLVRQVPIAYDPKTLTAVTWILITHDHMDHCDPHTIPALAEASPQARFLAPEPVRRQLREWGIAESRILPATTDWLELGSELKVRAVPAAHPRILLGQDGEPRAVGYLLERGGQRVWIAGDTSVCEELIQSLKALMPIHTALLPVNEDNFYRRRRGIVGNMSVREAFGLAAELNIEQVVPVHWDLFEINSTSPEEIQAVYRAHDWPFHLEMKPEAIFL
jgi:L-ascorbate metabolism protein UlaG (beta-lactamase superfamily)